MTSGAASLPVPAGEPGGAELPDLDRLRAALRPAQLPLPSPVDTREAAGRMNDLLHAERYREARVLAEQFRDAPADPEDRLALLRAALHGAAIAGTGEQVARDAVDLVTLLRRSGSAEQAAAVATVLLERGPFERHASTRTRAAIETRTADEQAPASRGRRRGAAPRASPEMLVVVRALERAAVSGPRDTLMDPRRDAARLRAALAALPTVRERLLIDPEQELRLRLAQALEGAGQIEAATTAALDVLELISDRAVAAEDPGRDPQRLATAAHAVLARTLGLEHPLQAVHHALEALEAMPGIEDPPLRIGLITALLQALMAAGATREASFTSGRLISLQRTLGRDALRTAPLLAVAAQRVQAERYDAAWVPLEQARAIARGHRDHPVLLEAARLAASLHERTGQHASALRELRAMAHQARWLADDLGTPTSARGELIRTELQANALAMRRALDLGRSEAVEDAARSIERRTCPDSGRPVLPAELLWDHRVDARVGRFIASEEAIFEQRHGEAAEAIEERPPGHETRARYWTAYLEDRYAHLLAERGLREPALAAARRAGEHWRRLGSEEDAARVDALVTSLVRERPGTD